MMEKLLNFNIGVLGHVDSGKTSLCKSLSTVASTAAFDKNPQSKERGITIDLGFSSFCIDAPSFLDKFSQVQITLVDCPGHASLIRTIIGGAQIIDSMILVIDISKGIQTQTKECIVIGEILCKKLIVVLNKIDLIQESKRKSYVEKITKKIKEITLSKTKFSDAKVVAVAARPSADESNPSLGIDELISEIKNTVYIPNRDKNAPLAISIDHCFGIRGQGTVITGTVLQGIIKVNENIDIPILKQSKKVKSIQMFRQPVESAQPGDRIGLCVTQFDPTLLERNLIGSSECIDTIEGFITEMHPIAHYKHRVNSKAKFHITMGHITFLAKITVFSSNSNFDFQNEFIYQDTLITEPSDDTPIPNHQYALVEFEKEFPSLKNSLFIASKLDMDVNTSSCRLAFWGKVLVPLYKNYKETVLPKLKVFKNKAKEGIIDRMTSDNEVIVKDLLKKGSDINLFIGLEVELSSGEKGKIEGNFGLSGKTKVFIANLPSSTKSKLKIITDSKKKKRNENINSYIEDIKVYLKFKKYIFSSKLGMIQS